MVMYMFLFDQEIPIITNIVYFGVCLPADTDTTAHEYPFDSHELFS